MTNIDLSTAKFIEKAQQIHGGKYTYDKVVFQGVHTPVIITCPVHGDFLQRPVKHTSQRCGCPACGREVATSKITHTREAFIQKARTVHGTAYTYDRVVYTNNNTPVIITCRIHGDFMQKPVKHTSHKNGCPRCAGVTNTHDFVVEATKVHDNKYDYSLVSYVASRTRVDIICPLHGIFSQTPNHHLQGYGCSECGRDQLVGRYCEATLAETDLGQSPGQLYFIKLTCAQTKDAFYKIGITKDDVNVRWGGKKHRIDVVATKFGTLYEMYIIEQHVLQTFKAFKYVPPSLMGDGHTECFKFDESTAQQITDMLTDF